MSFDFNINALLAYLREKNQKPELQKETNQVYLVYTLKGFEVPVFFLIRKESELLQMVAYLPYQVPKANFGEMARMLHLLNRDLDMPGFGMDESQNLIFYRSVIPCFDGKINKKLFNMYLGTTRLVCETFLNAIGMIAAGATTVDEAIKNMKPS
jgi:hypothetical protein